MRTIAVLPDGSMREVTWSRGIAASVIHRSKKRASFIGVSASIAARKSSVPAF